MGVVPFSLDNLQKYIQRALNRNWIGLKIMELGSQQMYCHGTLPEGYPAKMWFEDHGAYHTSVDLNGERDSVALDLSEPINRSEWNAAFDVVTDFGTSEHVGPGLSRLYQCRANCHRWCRTGGLLFFNNPKTGSWPQHGYHYFTCHHYYRLAEACKYRVLAVFEAPAVGNAVDGWEVCAVLQKEHPSPFVTLEGFLEICSDSVLTA